MPQVKKKQIQYDLEEWAKWYTRVGGFSSKTIIYKSMSGELFHGFDHDYLPEIEPSYPWMQRLNTAIAEGLNNRKISKYIQAARLWYLLGDKKIYKIIKKSPATIRRWRRIGEDILSRETIYMIKK